MNKLTLDAAQGNIAAIDLGQPVEGSNYFDTGDLASTGGNLYINIDGQEYGSLFFYRRDDGTVTVTLGAFDPERQDWIEKSELAGPIDFGEEDAPPTA